MTCATCKGALPSWYAVPTDPALSSKSSTRDGVTVHFYRDGITDAVTVYCSDACHAAGPEDAATKARVATEGYGRITGVIMDGRYTQSYRRARDRALWQHAHAPTPASEV